MNFAVFWFSTLLIKLLLGSIIPLSGDEAYYWVWAQKLQLGYFDHPPFTAWLFAVVPDILKVIARWPGIILGHLTFWVWFEIFKLQNLKNIKEWQIVAMLSPLLGVGSIVVTPDLPLLFFWTLATYIFLKALRDEKIVFYPLLGIALGLGFLSKYTIVLIVPVIFIYLFISKSWKKVRFSYLIFTVIFGLMFSLPVLVWNYQNDWLSFNFQIKRGLEQDSWNWRWVADFFFGTILVFFPTLFWGFIKGLKIKDQELLFHKVAALVPLIFFTYTSFKGAAELNWGLIAYPHMLILFFASNPKSWQQKSAIYFWGILYLTFAAGVFFPQMGQLHGKLHEPFKYNNAGNLPLEFSPLYTSTYQMASSLWYVSGVPVYKVKGVSRFDYFDMIPENVLPSHFFYIKEDYQEWPDALTASSINYKEVARPLPGHTVFEVNRQ